ncbi:MAG: translocation/assembly module TamB domain-containing protein [Prevotella sp.]|nr:translocation/assembly module TamB domain-containing protein [Prevotella sp.]
MVILLFGLLNTPAVQDHVKDLVVKELKAKLGTEAGIGRLGFLPFNTVAIDSLYLYDRSNAKVLMADKVSAGVDIFALMKGKIVVTSVWLTGFEAHLSKDSPDAPLNIQYVIDAFKSKDNKPKAGLDIRLNAVNLSNGRFTYDIKDQPFKEDLFDANHIQVSGLDAKITVKSMLEDSVNIQVKKVSLKEKSGLEISGLVFRVVSQGKKISIRGFELDLPSSRLALGRCEIDLTPANDTAKILDCAVLDCRIAPSYIAPGDLAAFVPALQNFKDPVHIRARVSGSMNDLALSELSVDYGEKMRLMANAGIRDIGDAGKMYLSGSIDELAVGVNEVESILDNFSKNKIRLPSRLRKFGLISFAGNISGYLKQLSVCGNLDTDMGTVKTDLLFGLNPGNGLSSFVHGKVHTSGFELGKLLDNKDMDKISLNLAVDFEKPVYGRIRGTAKGDIHNFDFKGYTYREITLDAACDGLRVDGQLNVNDENGILSVDGLFDLSDMENPELKFNAKARNVQPANLHLAEDMRHSYLSFAVDADFRGRHIDNVWGYVKISSIDFIREDRLFQMDSLVVRVAGLSDDRRLSINSSLLKGEIKGAYSMSSMINSMKQTLSMYLPALIKPCNRKKPDRKPDRINFDLQINNSESFSRILDLPVTVLSPSKIIGSYNNLNDRFNIEIFAPSVRAAGMNIKSGYVAISNPHDTIDAKINVLITGKKNEVYDIAVNSKIKDNLVNTDISLVNTGVQKARGDFSISTLLTGNGTEPLRVDINTLPSELLLNNASWKMNRSHVAIQDGLIAVDNFSVYNEDGSQEIKVNGKYTQKNSNDILKAELKNINLEYIFQTLAIDALQFGGSATGSLFVSSIERKPYANTRLEITGFKFNGTELGKLNLFSELDDETNQVILDGLIVGNENKQTKVSGTLDPVKQKLSIDFDADSIDIGFLNKYAETVFDNITGRGTGKVRLYGNFSNVTAEGQAFIDGGSVGIRFLNTRYSFSDTVYMKKDLVYFNDMTLTDQFNNKARASGKVAHDFFSNFMYLVDLSADNFLVYNASPATNPLFYGKVFGSGNGTVGGDERAVDVNIRMRTDANTLVRMNFMEDAVNEYSFITYREKQEENAIKQVNAPMFVPRNDTGMDINMNFYIDATPDATLELLMDPVGGDVLRGTGSGAMRFEWNLKASPRLYGTYNINRGNYNFTFQRLMEKRFSIQDGSKVQFRGDPFDATLDVEAIYKINASLNDLDKELAERVGQTTIPVNCVLNLVGPLKHPNVGLDIALPSADAEVERQVKNILNTQDEINKQVAYLLVLSKFKAPGYATPGTQTSDFAAVASATLSNQLTKIVSKIDDRWQLGTNIRYSDTELTNTEAELLLSSQLLNDRLLINGNFGYRNDINLDNESMITDIDIEYLLNNAGTWRIKAYNHYNEKYYSLKHATQTQGVGIIYRKDFDELRDLFKNQRLRPKKDTAPLPVVPDSIRKGSTLSPFIRMKK